MGNDAQADFAAMAAPGAEHERLRPFVGTFRADVKMWMGPGEPMVTTGTMVNTFRLGNRFLNQEYRGDATEGPFPNFEGHGYWGFNKATGKYEGFWIDTASTMMQNQAGTVDEAGKTWTMIGEMVDPSGESVRKRSVITLEDDDHHRMEMYFVKGDQEFKGMEIRYTRAK
jgi:hypothetical protein